MALKASPDHQARLLDLQAVDTKLQQIAHRLKTLPEIAALGAIAEEAERLRLRRSSEAGVLEDARTELTRIEGDVAVVSARITRDDQRLQGSSSVKDVAGLESELAALRRRRDELEEIELVVMERVETLESAVAITVREHEALAARKAEAQDARDAAQATLAADRADAEANRAAIAGGLPEDLVALYERQRARYGTGASHLRGGVSSASGVRLNANELQRIRAADPDEVILCPDSDAILVRTSESGL